MGRLAASIGFAFGSGVSAGISEKRRQDAADKRSRELNDAALNRIAKQQQNAIALQENADAIKDANILQQKIDETTANIPRMESMFPGSTKNILPGGLPNSTFKSIITFKAGEIGREQKELDRKQRLELFKIEEVGKEKRLGITTGAKKEVAGIKATRQSRLDRFKAAKETIKATENTFGQVIPGQEETNRLAREDLEDARQEIEGVGERIPIETELNEFERAANIMINGGIARGQTYDTLRSKFGDEVIATNLGEREAFVGGEIIEQPKPVLEDNLTKRVKARTGAIRRKKEFERGKVGALPVIKAVKKQLLLGKQLAGSKQRATLSDEEIADAIIKQRGAITRSGFSLGRLAPAKSLLGRNERQKLLDLKSFPELKKKFIEGR